MLLNKDSKVVYRELYEGYDKEKLLRDGKEYLESNLKIKVKKHTRIFRLFFWSIFLVSIWVVILGVVYLLERSNSMADSFEKHRDGQIKKYSLDAGD